MRARGVSLVEILLAASLTTLIVGMAAAWLSFSGRHYQSATGSSQLSRDLDLTVRSLRQDLKEASLLSIRSKPSGVSMSTARDEKGVLQRDARGDVAWQGHYYYTVEKNERGSTGTLVRWFKESAGLLPQPSKLPAWPIENQTSKKIVLRGVVLKADNPVVRGLGENETGFNVLFLRSDGSFSSLNPGEVGAEEERRLNTGLVEARLAVLPVERRGRESYNRIYFRVRPQR